MTKEQFDEFWRAKLAGEERFATAIINQDCVMHLSMGTGKDDESSRIAPAGSKVMITMLSRFGDLGIRDDRLDKCEHGYYCRVMPELLEDVKFLVSGS